MNMSTTDVLIIGAGPTGLTLALELCVQKIPFRLVDKLDAPSDKSRALVMQCRSQELLNRHPTVAQQLLERGVKGPGVNIYCNQKKLVTGTFDDLGFDDTRFPLPLWIPQGDTESALTRQLEDYGAKVERGVSAQDIKQDADSTTVTLVRGDEREVLKAKYIVGCDGAHSIVRKSTNLTFEGAQYPQEYILADVKLEGPYDKERVSMYLGSRIMVFFPLKNGVIRVVGERSKSSKFTGDPCVQEVQEFIEEMAAGTWEVSDPLWLAHFRWNCRGVNHYRDGRLFVAGDAAHIHSPAGGQGMNTGIQDAINLGWKLAAVLRGDNDDSLLDSYDEERHPVGTHLLYGTDRIFNMVASQNFIFTTIRNALMPWVAPYVWGDKARRLRMFTFISQMGIKYRRSPIVHTATGFEGPVKGGWRAPDGELLDQRGEKGKWLLGLTSNAKHTIVLFSGILGGEEEVKQMEEKIRADARYKELEIVKVFGGQTFATGGFRDKDGVLHKRYGFEKEAGLAVVRPDGYVSFIGSAESVEEFLSI
ncbi:monooxygenase FAD-binding protein [Colletotrichum truncatum]|uniref:Monooxygenase FAD-binding protein n=1 Tax=Colletotrichum truncatum TaxID=5467 RepID=A0ACC3Z1R7_COLTU|nr:monooxygenase FAD-binding protein [Colletotrichum truncatum]KAF6788811.1 monooxygenase FAD-binding protein [Colletotrichum truncatum]